jgi:hypothetical protein
MFLGAGLDPSDTLPPETIQSTSITIQTYQHVMKCKQLGLRLDASDFSVEEIDLLYTFHEKFNEVHSKRKGK